MQIEEKKALSSVRLEHAEECLAAAKSLLASGNYKSAANRSYYTVFHSMRAVLAYDEIDMVLFFNDPNSDDLSKDLQYIAGLCDQHNVPFATNVATAEMLIHGLARGDLAWRELMKPSTPLKV